jgi:hypothetical protein
LSTFAKNQRKVKKIVLILICVFLIAIILWWRAPIIGNDWSKQTIYVGLLDAWYGHSKDNKAYAMWIDDDSSIGVFKVKEIADAVGVPLHFAVIADMMEPQIADSLASWQHQGYGILLHGLHHERWQEWDAEQIEYDIQQSKQRLHEQGFDTTKLLKIIIPPHGCNTRTIRKVIAQQGCKMMSGASLVNPDRHVYQYGRLRIDTDTDLNTMQELLQDAYDKKAFVIFGTHSSIPEDFSEEKAKDVLRIAKEMGFCFNIYE